MLDINNTIAAYTVNQTSTLTGLTSSQLRRWDVMGFFRPHHVSENTRSPYSRLYTFRDIVGLRVISILKNDHKISLAKLKEVAEILEHHSDHPWSELKLSAWKKDVTWNNPLTGGRESVVEGQGVVFTIISVQADMSRKIEALKRRSEDQFGKFSQARTVAHNAVVFSGTRIPVETVRRFHAAGYSVEDILRQYPTLTSEDVQSALSIKDAA